MFDDDWSGVREATLLSASVTNRGNVTVSGFGAGFEDTSGHGMDIDPLAADKFAQGIMRALPSHMDRMMLLALFARHVTDKGYHDRRVTSRDPKAKDTRAWAEDLLSDLGRVSAELERDKEKIAQRIRTRSRNLKI